MAANPNDAPRHYYSLDEYFALEQASDARFEYWDGDIFYMSGAGIVHNRVAINIHFRLWLGLEGRSCSVFLLETGVQECLLVAQDKPQVDRYLRQADGNWSRED